MTDTALHNAVDNALTALARTNTDMANLHRQIDDATLRRQAIVKGLTALMRALPPTRQADISRRINGYVPGFARRDRGGDQVRMAAVMTFLAGWAAPEIRPNELQLVLENAGFALPRRYAANVLSSLNRTAHVTRVGRGRYRINHTNPDLIAARAGPRPTPPDPAPEAPEPRAATPADDSYESRLSPEDALKFNRLRNSTPEEAEARSKARRARMDEIRAKLNLPRRA